MTTQTATAEREPRGHYEIITGDRWVEIHEDFLWDILALWGRNSGLSRLELQGNQHIRTGPAEYRFVEDKPA